MNGKNVPSSSDLESIVKSGHAKRLFHFRLTVGIATYQAFVCMAAVLMLAILLERLTIRRDSVKAILLSALKAFLILVV